MISNISRNFPNIQMVFGKNIFIWPFLLNSQGFSDPHFWFSFAFLLKFSHDAEGSSNPSTYPSWGSDNSPPLKRISSRDSEVVGRKVGYSARRWSSLSQVASFSSDVTIALWGTWSSEDEWHALLNQEYEQGTLDKKGHLGDQAFHGRLRRCGLWSNAWLWHMEYIMYLGKVRSSSW